MFELMLLVAFWVVCGLAGGSVTRGKGRGGAPGYLLGFLLGPLGLLIAVVLPRNEAGVEAAALESGARRRCPQCAELVRREAVKCRHCGAELEPAAPPAEQRETVSPRRLVAAALVMGATILLLGYVIGGAEPSGDPYGLEAQP